MLDLLEVYERRRDLQEAFPEVMIKDYRRLLEWACGTVKKRLEDSDYGILKPYEKQFESILSLEKIQDPSIDKWAYYFRPFPPSVGSVSFGNLRRVKPISNDKFGWDRGLPIDRYYIEQFLSAHSSDISGRVLEIADNEYTLRFGGNRITKSDVLHAVEGNPEATIVADLTHADQIPSETFDCIIITQTLQLIYDVRAALRHLHRILKTGGVILATFPGISQIPRYDMDNWGDYWRFTNLSARLLFEETFGRDNVYVEAYGNVLTAIAFLHGLATKELEKEEFDYRDPDYEVVITVRAIKAS
jgi:SAM-dependent methyltransferase